MQQKRIVALGEALWDILPSGPRLGGAPANFCVMAGCLGSHSILASRLGDDELGRRMKRQLATLPVDVDYLQVDHELATGTVAVEVKDDGQPTYRINENAAWDSLTFTSSWKELATRADAVCFGTLAQRSERSRLTIQRFIAHTRPECFRVFDLNFRPPYVIPEVVRASLESATCVKLNEEELPKVFRLLELPPYSSILNENVRWVASANALLRTFSLQMVCITLGRKGSLVVTRDGPYRHPGIDVKVVDTVGAGDAFLAAIIHYLMKGASLREMSEAANRCGAWVASQNSAIPSTDQIASLRKELSI